MASQNYIVPPRSWDDIGRHCDSLRVQFSLEAHPCFPVVGFLEKVLHNKMGVVELKIRTKTEMGNYEGFTTPDGKSIILREDVYENACKGIGRDRFTVAHELGHFFLHTGIPMARADEHCNIKPFRLSEPQANQFAAELLMPRQFMSWDDTVPQVVNRHQVSVEAAENRIRFMKKKLQK